MKMQLKIAYLCLKKSFKWFLIMVGAAILYVISIRFVKQLGGNELFALLGKIKLSNADFFGILITIYQYSFTIYYSYLYYSFEIAENMDNILLRINSRSWFKSKIFVQILVILFFRLMYSFIVLVITSLCLEDSVFIVLSTLTFNVLLSVSVMFFINHSVKRIRLLGYIFVIFLVEVLLNNYAIVLNILICVLLIVYESFTFSLKKYIQN